MAVSHSYISHEILETRSWFKEIALVLGASIIIALFAQISIPLPFSPVPIATQAHVVLFLACLLGAKRASLAVLAFLGQGAIGLPVFAGGMTGLMTLAGPRGGYLLGYVAAAFVTGLIMERVSNRTPKKALLAMGIGNLIVYLFGLPWLSGFIGWKSALVLGFVPFIAADFLKLLILNRILKGVRFFRS